MTRTIRRTAAAALAAGGLWSGGCAHTGGCADGGCGAGGADGDRPGLQARYAGYVDPCWPDRYSAQARANVLSYFAQHATNGAVVDQTLFEWYFEPGTDTLLPSGRAKLDYLSRRRPAPDKTVYLQTARDLAYDATKPEALAGGRADLDAKRAAAVQKYLAATTASRGLNFEVQVVDLPDVTQSAVGPAAAVRGLNGQYVGGLAGGTGGLTVSGVSAGAVGGGLGGAPTAPGGGATQPGAGNAPR
jgi:hypothetical protein